MMPTSLPPGMPTASICGTVHSCLVYALARLYMPWSLKHPLCHCAESVGACLYRPGVQGLKTHADGMGQAQLVDGVTDVHVIDMGHELVHGIGMAAGAEQIFVSTLPGTYLTRAVVKPQHSWPHPGTTCNSNTVPDVCCCQHIAFVSVAHRDVRHLFRMPSCLCYGNRDTTILTGHA